MASPMEETAMTAVAADVLESVGRFEHGQVVFDSPPSLPEGARLRIRIMVEREKPAVDENGWPAGFFERFAGCIDDPTFERPPQGEYEVRESLA